MPYRTPPATRIAYDLDGTVALLRRADGSWYEFTERQKKYYNDERTGGIRIPNTWYGGEIALIFPTPIRLSGILALLGSGYSPAGNVVYIRQRMHVFVSKNTTNGEDGTWEQVVTGTEVWRNTGRPPGDEITTDVVTINMQTSQEIASDSYVYSQILNDFYRRPYPSHIFGYSNIQHLRSVLIHIPMPFLGYSYRTSLFLDSIIFQY